ncbi:Protein CBR-CYP-44A1 [Caenorhabditis briggsae]|uniref:Protein CBR-CYP-44A1 n=1 Tax=Caenorhabditis briggsae TaxID=6238 RepID=A8WUD0_CAEBR|nr:Protein CBR-CYP-44A1 [Caenorhabditis briggsae]CAP24092.2 Protein CBR-CYP-44A1 [Caenorhabditis briggsae]
MRRSIKILAENLENCPYTSATTTAPPRRFSEIPGPREIPVIGNSGNLKYAIGTADAQTVFAADGKTPFIVPLQETTQKYREMKGMNPGLGNLNGPEWYRLRSSIQHAMMRPQSVQTYLPFSQKVSDDLVRHVAEEQIRFGNANMQKVAGRWSLESAGQILFEKSLESLGNRSEWADGLIELNKKIFQLSAKMRLGLPIFRLFSTPSWRKMVKLEDEFYAEVDRLMDDALDNLKISESDSQNMRFASYLINRKELNRRDVKVILLSMFSDGLSTTAPMLIYNLYNIATHPEALRKIQEEIKEDPTSSKLPYLRACIKETFRMFPIGTEVSRITQKDLTLSGYLIPAGTAVDINTNILMRNMVLFSDSPHEFKPERWLEKSKSVHPFAFLPFGFGPRCVQEEDMHITQLVETLSDRAVITTLNSSSVIVYDKNELKIYLGFANNRETVEYAKEVVLLLSTPIPPKADIREIVVSKNGDFVILVGPRSTFVVRIGTEILFTSPDRLPSECFCECYSLHDSLILQNSSLSVLKCRILSEKCGDRTHIVAVLYSDSCVRFYNLLMKFESLLLSVDFRSYLHQGQDENVANNTFGLQKALVSFDLIPPQPKSSHFSLIVVDSDAEFYASFVHFSYLRYIQTSNPRIASVFVLVSGGGVLTHIIVFANEFGEFQLLVNDQLRLPQSSGDPEIVSNRMKKLNVNRYEIATSSCLYAVNISSWFEALTSSSYDLHVKQDTRVFELVNAIISPNELSNTKSWTGARPIRAVAVKLTEGMNTEESEEETVLESEDVMHLVILENKDGQPAHVFNVATFDSNTWDVQSPSKKEQQQNVPTSSGKSSLEEQLAALKPLAACVISDKVSCEEAIDAASKFFDAVDERMKKHAELAQAFVERCLILSTSAQSLDERQQSVDQRLIEETNTVEELKARMYKTKERMELARKGINVLFHRVEENVPLSDNEIRIFERLKEHQKMLSDMTILVPKMTLDSNELNRMTDVLPKKRNAGEEPSKFAAVAKNAAEIESLEIREKKLQESIDQLII